ncbi:MAG: hypothetical protein RLN99_02455 [Kiloniellaceae bacterium]
MTIPDPFNPRPGPLPDGDRHQYCRELEAGESGKAFFWIPVAVVGMIGIFAIIAAL